MVVEKVMKRIQRRATGKEAGPRSARRLLLGVVTAAAVALAPCPAGAQAGGQRPAAPLPAAAARVPGSGWLGVGADSRLARSDGRESIVITQVEPGSPADRAGLRAGDIVVRINGEDRVMRVFRTLPFSLAAGDTVHFVVQREGQERPVTVIAGERPGRYRLQWVIPVDSFRRLTIELMDSARAAAVAAGRMRELLSDSAAERLRTVQVMIASRRWEEARALQDSLLRLQGSLLRLQDSLLRLYAPTTPFVDLPHGVWMLRPDTGRRRGPVDALRVAADGRSATMERRLSAFAPGVQVIHALGERGVAGAEFVEMNDGLAQYFGGVRDGLLTLRVAPATPAARALLQPGDVVLSVDGRPVRSVGDLRAALLRDGSDRPREIRLGILRKGERKELRLALEQL